MKETLLTVLENTRLADGIYRLRLAGDTSAITAPGQFVNLKLSGFFLRRPISVCDWENGEVTLIYKVLGHGTEAMTGMACSRRVVICGIRFCCFLVWSVCCMARFFFTNASNSARLLIE